MIFRMALYGLKSIGAALCAHFSNTLNNIGFLFIKADADVWYRPEVKRNGFE